MSFCPDCGNKIKDNAKFCPNCGTELSVEEIEVDEFKFCPQCGFKMDKNIEFCPNCAAPTSDKPHVTNTSVSNSKNPLLAAALSFLIIGLGQVYLGLTKRGIILFFAAIVSAVLISILLGWIAWLIVWIYSIYDAYKSAEKINSGINVEDSLNFDNLF